MSHITDVFVSAFVWITNKTCFDCAFYWHNEAVNLSIVCLKSIKMKSTPFFVFFGQPSKNNVSWEITVLHCLQLTDEAFQTAQLSQGNLWQGSASENKEPWAFKRCGVHRDWHEGI